MRACAKTRHHLGHVGLDHTKGGTVVHSRWSRKRECGVLSTGHPPSARIRGALWARTRCFRWPRPRPRTDSRAGHV